MSTRQGKCAVSTLRLEGSAIAVRPTRPTRPEHRNRDTSQQSAAEVLYIHIYTKHRANRSGNGRMYRVQSSSEEHSVRLGIIARRACVSGSSLDLRVS